MWHLINFYLIVKEHGLTSVVDQDVLERVKRMPAKEGGKQARYTAKAEPGAFPLAISYATVYGACMGRVWAALSPAFGRR